MKRILRKLEEWGYCMV